MMLDVKKLLVFSVILVFAPCVNAYEPLYSTLIGNSNVDNATAYSNGFKIVPSGEIPEENLWTVYSYDDSTVNWASSTDRGVSWVVQELMIPPGVWGEASQPSIDVMGIIPVIVYRSDSAGNGEIFVESPMDFCMPARVSYTADNSFLPAIVIDDTGGVHIVWQEDMPGNSDIFYYYSENYCTPGFSINLTHSDGIYDSYPSISIFNGGEVHVIWRRNDPLCDTPYSICHGYIRDGLWHETGAIFYTWEHLDNPSLDYCKGEDSLSAAWEYLDGAYFHEGNGGGYSTPGMQRFPVLSTIGRTWSYLYWEDTTPENEDIYSHLFYFDWRWNYNFRSLWDNKVRYPSTSGCYVVWTQGVSVPFQVMFSCEGYPISIEEQRITTGNLGLKCYPNPFNSMLNIEASPGAKIEIVDLTGRIIFAGGSSLTSFNENNNTASVFKWSPVSNLPGGIYFVKVQLKTHSEQRKVFYLK